MHHPTTSINPTDYAHRPVIVYGPQGCGKTRNATALAAFFGKTKIVDEYIPGHLLSQNELGLTNCPCAGALDYDEVLRAMRGTSTSSLDSNASRLA